jgi:hypothetical protein
MASCPTPSLGTTANGRTGAPAASALIRSSLSSNDDTLK